MNSGESIAGSSAGDVSNQPSRIESSQSHNREVNLNLGSPEHPFQALFGAESDPVAMANAVLNHVNASIASFRVTSGQEWEYIYLSTGNLAVFGYTAEEFIADKSLWFSRIHPDDETAVRAVLIMLLQKTQPLLNIVTITRMVRCGGF